MNKQRTMVFFGAHPDDESFGMGSTLAHYAAAGVKTYYVCSTRGELGTVALKYLKIKDKDEKICSVALGSAARVAGFTGVF